MHIRSRTRTGTIATAAVMLVTTPVAVFALAPAENVSGNRSVPHVQRLHTVTTTPAAGKFRCGDLRLTVTHGTETEIFDGTKTRGVTFIEIHRNVKHVTLRGSDGRVYRIGGGVARSKVVLVEPEDDKPVWATEIIELRFHNRQVGSPGYLREVIKWRNGVRTDVVTGPCDFS